ncbi:hypothetical protein Cgig2_001229 [Carnegiea gigantea]|uniref:NB-ARC domain-containing protein n=1 Tax=Carnegiea gigantea TaxID=171969 RepID=A0A9Q1JZ06_9CARY|nr:hypothetical protein Cgig2_001229 [Carnegiea gigantea]
MSQEIKKIREKLDGIADDAAKFGFKCDYNQPIRRERKQTCSYVYADSVIGREDDKIKIVDMLLDANVEGALPVISIVGVGGQGKTTLARLVFNDNRIGKEFPERLWVCVTDQDQHQWNIRHIHFQDDPSDGANRFISKAQIRTYLQGGDVWEFQFALSALLKKWMNLRALHLARTNLQSLSNDIGKLLHLRYLDLSKSGLVMLPKSITKLVNLQTLHLNELDRLKELPRDLNRLVKLRVLGIAGCKSLQYMPDDMNRMTCLNTLSIFLVAKRDSSMKQRLKDLRALSKLKGSLEIRINKKFVYKKEINSRGGGYISNKKYLNLIEINWFRDDEDENESENEEGGIGNTEDLLDDLQPHSNLNELSICQYRGTKIPSRGIENNLATFLPKLVDICISQCHGLQSLPWLGKLQFLKSLDVRYSSNLKYMEDRIFSWNDSSTGSCGAAREVIQQEFSSFFPSLESLYLVNLPELKGWWRRLSTSGSVMEDDEVMGGESSMQTVGADRLPSFPRLSELKISECHNLTVIPLCPTVETLTLRRFNERLQIMTKKEEDQREKCGSSDSGSSSRDGPKMRVVSTDNARHLKSLPPVAFQCLAELEISGDSKLESLSEVEVVFRSCSSSLRTLEITRCSKLRSVSGGLEYLTALESLELSLLEELRFDEIDGEGEGEGEEADRTDMPWRCLGQCLRSLRLQCLTKVDDLPKGMCYLTALQFLLIRELPLKDLPEWIGCLSSLQSLLIVYCKHLESLPEALRNLTSLRRLWLYACEIIERRCQSPDGEDWPKIQHIPYGCNEAVTKPSRLAEPSGLVRSKHGSKANRTKAKPSKAKLGSTRFSIVHVYYELVLKIRNNLENQQNFISILISRVQYKNLKFSFDLSLENDEIKTVSSVILCRSLCFRNCKLVIWIAICEIRYKIEQIRSRSFLWPNLKVVFLL